MSEDKIKEFLVFLTIILLVLLFFHLERGVIEEDRDYPDIPHGRLPKEDDGEESGESNGGNEKGKAKVAIIIDDLGNSFEMDKRIAGIDSDLTLAILPSRNYTVSIAEYFSGFDRFQLIIHLPLEPLAPKDAEEDMIMTNMGEREIKSHFKEHLNQLGEYVVGVNNHKGSKFTSNREKMKVLLKEIKVKNLFFIDSFTYKDSIAYEVAKGLGVRTVKRDVFLDNINEKSEITKKLEEVVGLAKKEGSAVAIGHSKTNTISVLQERLPEFEKEGIDFVKVSEVLE